MNKPTFVLVHGAWHDSSCWAQVAELLQARGCKVYCPDLPGHGANSLPLDKVTLKRYAGALVELLQGIDTPIALVGHSMAGMVITEVACQLPEKIQALIYLCAYLPRPGESVFELIALNRSHEPFTPIELALELSDDKRSCSITPEQIIPLFYGDADAPTAALLQARFGSQASLPLSSKVRFDQDVFTGLPTTYISCSRDKVIPLHHQRRMLARQPCKTLLQIDSDHSPFHSNPQQLAELLFAAGQP